MFRCQPGWVLGLIVLLTATAAAAEPQSLRVAYMNLPPLGYTDDSGQPHGFVVDSFDAAARRVGLRLIWQRGGDTRTNNDALRMGALDLVATGTDSPERRKLFYVSDPWWSLQMVAVTRAVGPIRSDADLDGMRLAVPGAVASLIGAEYPGSQVMVRGSSVEAADSVCTGGADAALFAMMFLRQLLLANSPVCRDVSLRTLDSRARIDYRLVARPQAAKEARALYRGLEAITEDGTLTAIAARHPPVSTPYATRLSQLVRLSYERRIYRVVSTAVGALLVLGIVFGIRQQRARKRLAAVNARLEEDIRARTRTEAALRDSEARFRTLLDSAPQTVLALDPSGMIAFANAKAGQMFGYPHEELIWTSAGGLFPERFVSGSFSVDALRELSSRRDLAARRKDGSEFPVEVSVSEPEASQIGLTLVFIADITERTALEHQLQQAQKLESVGRLAGGVAHDFNNLLTVISGYAQMALDDPQVGPELREPLEEISNAAGRATSLTRQLLIFSRRQMVSPKTVALNELVWQLEKMLRRLIGEDIELQLSLDPRTGFIRADPGHIEQVVMNLAVNARDAMPNGGRLTIETAARRVDEAFASLNPELRAGDYVLLKVTDTGTGMTPEVKARIFEPFFTTKELGKGTGLGLAMVYGIVRQTGAAVLVDSEPGRGTTFEILFPAVKAAAPAGMREPPAPEVFAGKETILLAEDEPGVRKYVREVLQMHGYHVLEAENGAEAMNAACRYAGPIHLLLTDVIMPELGGIDLAEKFTSIRPGTPVLLMSGYTDRVARRELAGAFIEKPFTPAALLGRIREMMDGAKRATHRPSP
jgi:PAS domain S-box-containing protein